MSKSIDKTKIVKGTKLQEIATPDLQFTVTGIHANGLVVRDNKDKPGLLDRRDVDAGHYVVVEQPQEA